MWFRIEERWLTLIHALISIIMLKVISMHLQLKLWLLFQFHTTNTRFFRYMDWKEWLFVNLMDNNKLVNNTPSCLGFWNSVRISLVAEEKCCVLNMGTKRQQFYKIKSLTSDSSSNEFFFLFFLYDLYKTKWLHFCTTVSFLFICDDLSINERLCSLFAMAVKDRLGSLKKVVKRRMGDK